jgi:hypothetical protein
VLITSSFSQPVETNIHIHFLSDLFSPSSAACIGSASGYAAAVASHDLIEWH